MSEFASSTQPMPDPYEEGRRLRNRGKSDIVDVLRSMRNNAEINNEAADVIERLRGLLMRVVDEFQLDDLDHVRKQTLIAEAMESYQSGLPTSGDVLGILRPEEPTWRP